MDTAPTGHTLRLLTYPDFLDRFIDRLLTIRARFDGASALMGGAGAVLGGLGNMVGGLGGVVPPPPPPPGADATEGGAVAALKDFQQQMRELQELLHDPAITEFAIVTIPTALALTESERLLLALRDEGIAVRSAIVNRLINEDAADSYLEQLAKGQQGCLGELNELAARCDVDVTPVPYFDVEVRSAYGLRAMGAALFDAPKG